MRNFLDTVDGSDVVKSVDGRGKTTVKTEDLIIDQGSQWQVVEEVGKVLPDICVAVLPQALVVETIYLSDLSRFVVSSQNCDPVAVSDLERYEQCHSLNRVVSTVNVVTHEEIVGVGRVTTDAEKL